MSFLDITQVQRSVYDAICGSGGADGGRDSAVARSSNLSVAPSRIALAKLEVQADRGDRRALPAEGQARADSEDLPADRDRLSADARTADRECAGRRHASADSDSVVLLRPGGHGRPARDDREGPAAARIRRCRFLAWSSRCTTSGRRWPKTSACRSRRSSAARSSRRSSPRASGSRRARRTRNPSSRYAPESTGASEYYSLCEEVIDRA